MSERHSPTTPVINFDPSPAPFRYEKGTPQWLLWPFWAFKVLIPQPRRRHFHLLERFILNASAAGARTTGRIAILLELNLELVEFIVADLQARGFLDQELLLTPEGAEILRNDEEQEQEQEMVSGFLFYESTTNQLWPRFVAGSINHCDAEIAENGSASLRIGSPGRPRQIKAFTVWPDKSRYSLAGIYPQAPDSFEIGDALRRYHQEYINWGRFAEAQTDSFSPEFDFRQFDPRGARLIDSEPLPYFLLTHVHMPENLKQASQWQVCDPFGLGLSTRLRKIIQESIDGHRHPEEHPLRKYVIERAIGDTYQKNDTEITQLLMAQFKQAIGRLEKHFGKDRLPTELLQLLAQMEQDFQAAQETLQKDSDALAEADRYIRAFLRNVYASLEEVFAEVIANYPDVGLHLLGDSSNANGNLICKLARQQGFIIDDLMESRLSIEASRAHGILEYGNRDLLTSFALLILVGSQRPDHPIRILATALPEAGTFLLDLRDTRGAAIHAGNHDTDPARRMALDTLQDYQKKVLQICDALLPSIGRNSIPITSSTSEIKWDAEMMCKLRAQATYKMRAKVKRSLKPFPLLQGRLVETLLFAHELQLVNSALDSEENVSGLPKRKCQDLVFAGAGACEAILKQLVHRLPQCDPPAELSRERDKNTLYLRGLAREFRYHQLEESPPIEALLNPNPERLIHTLETGAGTINTLLWTALIRAQAARNNGSRSAHDLVQTLFNPHRTLFTDLARVSSLRGHGNEFHLTTAEAPDFVETIFASVTAILDAIE